MHRLPGKRGEEESGEEWFEDAIFVPDAGEVRVETGYTPGSSRLLWEHSIEFVALTVASAIGLWMAVLLRAGCADNSGGTVVLAAGASIVLVGLVALALFYTRNRSARARRRPYRLR